MHWGTQRAFAVGSAGVLLVVCAACGSGGPASPSTTSAALKEFDTAQLDATVAAGVAPGGAIPGRLAAVLAPDFGVHWEGAAGIANRETGDPLRPDDAVRLSTVTRTFT